MSDSKVLVYIEGHTPLWNSLFDNRKVETVNSWQDASVIIFTGGQDISPSMYGETPIPKTHVNADRDAKEVSLYFRALRAKGSKAFVGICRGAQLLNVLNGGKLWQDVKGHITDHPVFDTLSKKTYKCSSTHHQMMKAPKPGQNIPFQLLAWGMDRETGIKSIDTEKFGPEKSDDLKHDSVDIEAMWYPTTRSLCFQPHPEYGGYPECRTLFRQYFDTLVVPSLSQGTA